MIISTADDFPPECESLRPGICGGLRINRGGWGVVVGRGGGGARNGPRITPGGSGGGGGPRRKRGGALKEVEGGGTGGGGRLSSRGNCSPKDAKQSSSRT